MDSSEPRGPVALPNREEIAQDHRHLEAILDRLEVTTVPWRIAPLLEELEHVLTRHFKIEEGAGGFYERLETLSEQGIRAQRLLREHSRLLQELRTLLATTRERPNGPGDDIRREASRLTLRLRRHEEEENIVLGTTPFADLEGPGRA